MTFIPESEIRGQGGLNMAPMIDFLFLMLMFFACLSITRMAARDTDIDLVELKADTSSSVAEGDDDLKLINISILADGGYKWITDIHDYPMLAPNDLRDELLKQYNKGLLPKDKHQTQVLLKIDKTAQWEPILKAIFAIREAGFEVHPVYEPEEGAENLSAA